MGKMELTREIRDTIKKIIAHKSSFAAKVRQAASALASADCDVSAANLCELLDLVTSADKKPLATALRDMKRRGEIESQGVGVYAVKALPKAAITKSEKMWRVLRARRRVSPDDLVELASVGRDYAKQWLWALGQKKIVVNVGAGMWRLAKDVGPTPPEMKENAEKLRGLRKASKIRQAIEALARGQKAFAEADEILREMEGGRA